MKTKPLNIDILARSLAFSLLLLNSGIANAGTIAQSPLFITSSLDPNIMFIIDDSGSMKNSFVPDSLCSLGPNAVRVYSSSVNGLAYNPNTNYVAPLDANGASLGNSPFTAAWKDGYALPHPTSGTIAARGVRVNLSSQYQPTFSANTTGCSSSTEYAGSAQAAYYYKFTPGISGCPAPGNINSDSCYSKVVVSATSGPGNTDERQNFANWYSYYRTRILTTKAGASRAFAQLDTSPRVGYGRLNKSTTTPTIDGLSVSTIERGVRAFSGTDRQAYFTWLFGLAMNTYTPTRRALDAAGRYYSNESSSGPWSTTPGASGGTLYSCRQSYTILMTDGYWNDASAATTGARSNNDGTTTNNMTIADPGNTTSFNYTPASPFRDTYSDTLADVAMYYWKRDLCSTLANNVPISVRDPAFWQHMATYGIGLGVPTQVSPTAAFDAITTGASINWPDPQVSNTNAGSPPASRIDDLLHAGVNGHGGFLNANDTDAFVNALKSTLTAITDNTRTSASAAAANSSSLQGDTLLYLAKFKPVDWYGTLTAYPIILTNGDIDINNPNWEASDRLPAAGSRNILTLNPAASTSPHGSLFQWGNLTATQQGYLNKLNATATPDGNGEKRLNWLRGDTSNEKRFTGGIFRNRTVLLGDIVNSDPVFVGTQDYGYASLSGTEGSAYASFRSAATYQNRVPTLYVGANDGMLHAFDARKNVDPTDTGGVELFAYVPNVLFPELSKLTDPNYSHQYYVDGNSSAGDAYFGSAWHTMLVGTTGAGGRALFALDITDPANFGTDDVLWEFTNTNDSDLGYTLAQASIVRTNDDSHPWVVIIGNGYNSDNGHSVLFVLDAQTGSVVKKIDTGSAGTGSNKNGLSSPLAVDTTGDKKVDVVYAGDLNGNMWKFDFSSTNASAWDVAFKTGGVNIPLFVACNTTGTSCTAANRQAITAKPNAGAVGPDQATPSRMLYFGTGKYFETGDGSIAANPQIQSFYGIWDQNAPVADRANLQEQSIIFEGFPTLASGGQTGNKQRIISNNAVCYSTSSAGCNDSSALKKGWVLNLMEGNETGGLTAKGERSVSFPLVRRGFVIFSTIIPDPDPCVGGGTSWLMEVGAFTGGRTDSPPFDINSDNQVNGSDKVTLADGTVVTTSGTNLNIGLFDTPAVVESIGVDFKYFSGSLGSGKATDPGDTPATITPTTSPVPHPAGRQAWRQLR